MDEFSLFPATLSLIAINIAASLYGWANPQFLMGNLFHVSGVRSRREYHRLLTAGFLHAGVFHLLINMFVLYQFGRIIEAFLGTPKFLIVYFAALIGGNLWAYLENFRSPDYRALGASGATSGIIISFCLFLPFETLYLIVIPMPAIVFAIAFIAISILLAQNEDRVIGHEAHIGGALFGLVSTMIVEPGALGNFSRQVSVFLGGG